MKKPKDNSQVFDKLKSDIIALKEFIAERYGDEVSPQIDSVVAEMNDLLLGIERGKLMMPYKELRLESSYFATDGAYERELEEKIYVVQQDIYSLKRHIVVLAKPKLFFKKEQNINWLFPNLDCGSGKVQCIMWRDEDMMTVTFPNGYEIDLGYYEPDDNYIITIVKDDNWTDIIEEIPVKRRSELEKPLQDLIYKYEKMPK